MNGHYNLVSVCVNMMSDGKSLLNAWKLTNLSIDITAELKIVTTAEVTESECVSVRTVISQS